MCKHPVSAVSVPILCVHDFTSLGRVIATSREPLPNQPPVLNWRRKSGSFHTGMEYPERSVKVTGPDTAVLTH